MKRLLLLTCMLAGCHPGPFVPLQHYTRTEAFDVVRRDPQLADPRHAALRAAVVRTWGSRLALGTIG